ncbi:MAG TPA: phosphoglycerate mutase family protein [Allosphingosinicella sp.]|jgi:phosphohistidine phosphatase SixA
MRLFALFAAFAALAACATTTPDPAVPVYYVMRHLHTPAGERDPDLTAEGRRQAALLPGLLRDRPRTLYVSSYKRTQQTAAPLAAALDLTPIVYDPADTPALLARARQGPFPVLIVGHSNTVPDIVAGLGGQRPAPLVHEDFGDVWKIAADGTTRRVQIDSGAND